MRCDVGEPSRFAPVLKSAKRDASPTLTFWRTLLCHREVKVQQHDRFVAEPFDLIVIRSPLQSPARLEIGFGAGSTRVGWTRFLFKSVIGQAPPKMRGQTDISWIHNYSGSETIECPLVYPLLNPGGHGAF